MDISAYSQQQKWDLKTRSPQKVFAAIRDAIADMGYEVEVTEPFRLEQSAISDTASLEAQAVGKKQMNERYNWRQALWAIVPLATVAVLFVFGFAGDIQSTDVVMILSGFVLTIPVIALLATAFQSQTQYLTVTLEGETHKPAHDGEQAAETVSLIADVHIMAVASTALFAGGDRISDKVWRPDNQVLEADFNEIKDRFEGILPSFGIT